MTDESDKEASISEIIELLEPVSDEVHEVVLQHEIMRLKVTALAVELAGEQFDDEQALFILACDVVRVYAAHMSGKRIIDLTDRELAWVIAPMIGNLCETAVISADSVLDI